MEKSMKKVILFQGDSITDCGRDYKNKDSMGKGYAAICAMKLRDEKRLEFYNRGVSGDRASHMRARWQTDCLDLMPDVLCVAEGVNEVLVKYFEGDVIPLSDFERDYVWCIEQAKNANPNLKLIIVEPFVQFAYHPQKLWDNDEIKSLLPAYSRIVKRVADKYADIFIPLHSIYLRQNKKGIPPCDIAEDGIHPTALGHYIYATHMIRALAKVLK